MTKYYLTLNAMMAFSGARGGQGCVIKTAGHNSDSYIVLASFVVLHKKLVHCLMPGHEWWWRKEHLRDITEEQALDPNFRKFMYKMYSGDPDGELDEIL